MTFDPLVVTFCDWRYQPLLSNWLLHLAAVGVRNVRVFCLDEATARWCQRESVDAVALSWNGDLRGLWQLRLDTLNRLLSAGQGFVHSDLDAIWLRNPLAEDHGTLQAVDLAFSQGTVWPPAVHSDWGFVLCCGWFSAQPTTAVRRFFSALATDVTSTGDDQVSVNRLLQSAHTMWANLKRPDYDLTFRNSTFHCWREPLLGRTEAGNLSIALLPHRLYQRLPDSDAGVRVKHFLTPKNRDEKVAYLQGLGLWK